MYMTTFYLHELTLKFGIYLKGWVFLMSGIKYEEAKWNQPSERRDKLPGNL